MSKISEAAREGFLYQLWINKPFPLPLPSLDGQTVQIVEKGIRNYDAGPDFLNALVRLDGDLIRGDVEIHPLAVDWYSHRHHLDPRYNSVILHIVTQQSPSGFIALRQDGTAVATVNLDDALDIPADQMEWESYALSPAFRQECGLIAQPFAVKERILRQAGEKRLHIKAQRFVELRNTADWPQIAYAAYATSLGYSKNHLAFARLAQIMPVARLWRNIWNDPREIGLQKSEAYLFGASGLLPEGERADAVADSSSDYVHDLLKRWHDFPERLRTDRIQAGTWQFFRLRPINFPTRRIAALAALVVRFSAEGFITPLLKILDRPHGGGRPVYRELEEQLQVNSHPFWSYHFHFQPLKHPTGEELGPLLGKERSRDLVINVVLPLLMAFGHESENHRLLAGVQDLYHRYPRLEENEITRWMRERLFPDFHSFDTYTPSALYQQGFIHLYKSVCTGEGVCTRCLAE
jgi:hypothetical protein